MCSTLEVMMDSASLNDGNHVAKPETTLNGPIPQKLKDEVATTDEDDGRSADSTMDAGKAVVELRIRPTVQREMIRGYQRVHSHYPH
jgi:hypothetical protein